MLPPKIIGGSIIPPIISNEYGYKNPQQNISKLNLIIYKKDHTPWSSWTYSRDARLVQYSQINQRDRAFWQTKNKTHLTIADGVEKAFNKIQCRFIIKALTKIDIERPYFKIIKAIQNKSTGNIILKGEKLKPSLIKSGARKGC